MTAPASLAFNVDQPVDWRPASPDLEISGWLHPGAGAECLDLRARIDGEVFLGIYGLDRPDAQQAFAGDPAAGRSGFHQQVRVWTGARELALDYLDARREWREFFRTSLDT